MHMQICSYAQSSYCFLTSVDVVLCLIIQGTSIQRTTKELVKFVRFNELLICYIEVLFRIFSTITGVKEIVLYTENFVK